MILVSFLYHEPLQNIVFTKCRSFYIKNAEQVKGKTKAYVFGVFKLFIIDCSFHFLLEILVIKESCILTGERVLQAISSKHEFNHHKIFIIWVHQKPHYCCEVYYHLFGFLDQNLSHFPIFCTAALFQKRRKRSLKISQQSFFFLIFLYFLLFFNTISPPLDSS